MRDSCRENELESTLENTVLRWKYRVAYIPSINILVVLIILNKDLARYPFPAGILVTVSAASLITCTYYWAEYLKHTKRWLWF